jgi:hypothetical protein
VHVVDISDVIGVSVGATGTSVGRGFRELAYYYADETGTNNDTNTWSAKTNEFEPDGSFYLYANDIHRGLDIYRYDAGAPESELSGTWLTPAEDRERKEGWAKADLRWRKNLPFCMLGGLRTAR